MMHIASTSDAPASKVCHNAFVRTTIDLPEPLLKNARRRAEEHGVTLSALIEDAVRVHLAAPPKRSDTPFRLHTVRGRLVRPNLDLDRTSALLIEDDEADFPGEKR
jgi:hypothetical protein